MLQIKTTQAGIAVFIAMCALGCAAHAPVVSPLYHRVQAKGVVGLAATELTCEPEQVIVWDKSEYVRASGCGRVAYFVKRTPKKWERAGPLFEIAEKDRGA